ATAIRFPLRKSATSAGSGRKGISFVRFNHRVRSTASARAGGLRGGPQINERMSGRWHFLFARDAIVCTCNSAVGRRRRRGSRAAHGAAGTIYRAPTGQEKPKNRSKDRPLQKKEGGCVANCSSRRQGCELCRWCRKIRRRRGKPPDGR